MPIVGHARMIADGQGQRGSFGAVHGGRAVFAAERAGKPLPPWSISGRQLPDWKDAPTPCVQACWMEFSATVPEPASALRLLAGLATLSAFASRRQRKAGRA